MGSRRCLRPRRHTGESWKYRHTDAIRRGRGRQDVWRNGVCKTLAHIRLFTTRQRYIFSGYGKDVLLSSASSIRPCRRHEIPITPHQATTGSAVWGCDTDARGCVSKTRYYVHLG